MIYLLTVLDADANFIIPYAIVADCKSISAAKAKMKKHTFDQKSTVWSIRLQSVENR